MTLELRSEQQEQTSVNKDMVSRHRTDRGGKKKKTRELTQHFQEILEANGYRGTGGKMALCRSRHLKGPAHGWITYSLSFWNTKS